MQSTIEYLLAIDALKNVNRCNYVTAHAVTGKQRLENSAEHSWHLAMACWALAAQFHLPVDQAKLFKMALIHDLGEIDAGDTFLFDTKRHEAHIDERVGVARLASLAGNIESELLAVWDEQETGNSLETKLLKAVDRLLPFMLNLISEGGAWRDHHIKRSQVEGAVGFIANDFPTLHAWMAEQIVIAETQGWLQPE